MQIAINDLEDARIAAFRNVRDRDLLREHEGAFVAEGEVVLRVLIESQRPTRCVLLSEAQARRLEPLLERLPASTPVYVAPQPLVEAIVGFPMHRGVLAIGDRGAPANQAQLLDGAQLALGLCGITNHDNVGGLFRNAAAFGVGAVLLDQASCDPLYRKAIRVSVGGALVVPYARVADEAAMLEALSGHTVLALSPRGELEIGRDPAPRGRVALLVGTEGPGLSEETLRRCPTARIPMQPGWDSLNVAVSSAIALHWLRPSR